jgi:hypothetical protein
VDATSARRRAPTAVAVAVLLLGACTDDSTAGDKDKGARSGSSTAKPTTEPTESSGPGEVMHLPTGSGAGYVALEAGRYTGPLSRSLRYEVDVSDDGSQVFGGAFINTSGGGLLFVAHAPRRSTALPAHPCRDHTNTVVGPAVRDLASPMSRQSLLEVSKPVPVTVGGQKGLFLTVTVPDDVETFQCVDSKVYLYDDWAAGAGYVGRWWILDVAGDRYVVHAECSTSCSQDEVDRLSGMVESMTFAAR